MRAADVALRPFADVPSIAELTEHGGDVVLSSVPQAILGEFFTRRANATRDRVRTWVADGLGTFEPGRRD